MTVPQILYLHDADGNLAAVQISAALWQRIGPLVKDSMREPQPDAPAPHRMEEFAEFMQAWTFGYAYAPRVQCPSCHNTVSDWQTQPGFTLHSASLGGLLVFKCHRCGGTVRQKYFKDHMALEFTPAGR